MIDESFVRSIGIMIIASALFALGARVVSLPSIVAFLAAGLVLGPLTGILEVSDSIHLIAETGIVLLLFLVGLELSFDKIKGVGVVAVVAGASQMVLTILGGFGLCLLLGFAKMPALVIGIALAFSSTVIVVKLLIDNGDSNKHYGQIAIGILLVQDLFVVILLTLVSGLSGEGSLEVAVVVNGLGKALGGMALLLAMVLAASRWLLRTPFTWAARSPETLFIWSLCWCFLIVVATHFLHLSPEIGAFIAGISLAQLPYHRDLQRRVQPLMHFFIAVFFVSLGIEMKLDVSPVFWAQATVLALFVVVGKFVIVMSIVARLGYSERTSYFAALLLTQISEFSFILVSLGAKAGFVDSAAAALLGLIGLISITISTVAIVFREPLYEKVHRLGLCRMFGASSEDPLSADDNPELEGHVIIVGMNSLGRELAERLEALGEQVLVIDVDPEKLARSCGRSLLGDAESSALLREAGIEKAKLLVSTLHIELTNDLLAYWGWRYNIPCSIHAVDLKALDHLLDMGVKHFIVPKADGITRQKRELQRLGFLPS